MKSVAELLLQSVGSVFKKKITGVFPSQTYTWEGGMGCCVTSEAVKTWTKLKCDRAAVLTLI